MSWLWTGQKYGGVKPITRIPTCPLLITGFPTVYDEITEKPTQIRYQSKRSHTTSMIRGHAEVGKQTLNTCKLFGNLAEFSSLCYKSTESGVMSPCLQIMLLFEVCSYLYFNK